MGVTGRIKKNNNLSAFHFSIKINNHTFINFCVIQALQLAFHVTSRSLTIMFLKHRGISDFPITKDVSKSSSIVTQNITVICSLFIFPPL